MKNTDCTPPASIANYMGLVLAFILFGARLVVLFIEVSEIAQSYSSDQFPCVVGSVNELPSK